jgi:hypothetical protein
VFKVDHSLYQRLDSSARQTVGQKLFADAKKAGETVQRTVKIEENKLDRILIAVSEHRVKDTVIVSQSGAPDRSIDLYHGLPGEVIARLVRAKQRKPAVQVALNELRRAKREDDMPAPELIRQRYPGLREVMVLRIGGRGGGERAARALYEQDLERLLATTPEWWDLAQNAGELAILHRPDQVAGGYDYFEIIPRPPADDHDSQAWKKYLAQLRKLFGPANVNSKIGSDWSRLIKEVRANIAKQVVTQEAQPINRLNLRLLVQGGP